MGISAALASLGSWLGSGAAALGIGEATAATIGTVAADALAGAGVGAATGAITGGDIGMGALTGGLTFGAGGLGGALGPSLGLSSGLGAALGGGLAGVAGSAITGGDPLMGAATGALGGYGANAFNPGAAIGGATPSGAASAAGSSLSASGGALPGGSLGADLTSALPMETISSSAPSVGGGLAGVGLDGAGAIGGFAGGTAGMSGAKGGPETSFDPTGGFGNISDTYVGTDRGLGAGAGLTGFGVGSALGGGNSSWGQDVIAGDPTRLIQSDIGVSPSVGTESIKSAIPTLGGPPIEGALNPAGAATLPGQGAAAKPGIGSELAGHLGLGPETGGWLDRNGGTLLQGGLMGIGAMRQQSGLDEMLGPLKGAANKLTQQGDALSGAMFGGQLPAGAKTAVDMATQAAKARTRSTYAQLGLAGSTMEADALNSIDRNAAAQTFQMADQLLQQGMKGTAMGQDIYNTILSTQMSQDRELSNAIAGFAAQMMGAQAPAGKTITLNLGR